MIPGMYGTYLKHRQYFQPISFNNIRPQLTRVVSVVWDVIYYMWQLVFANIIDNNKSGIIHYILVCVRLIYLYAVINT